MTQLVMGQSKTYENTIPELNPSYRLLLGPGPCNVDPRVLRIASAPQLGHLDPELFSILEDTAQLLREVFQTKNEMTLCVSGSGFSGAEAVLSNLLEEGDTIIAGSLGFFSGQIVEISNRAGAKVINLATELGKPLEAAVLEQAFKDVNYVVCDSDWEAGFCETVENALRDVVLAYVKNHGLGFEVPYAVAGGERRYRPDFILKIDDGNGLGDPLFLVVEIKGYRGIDAQNKREAMDTHWVPAVNNHGGFGRWGFLEIRDTYQAEAMVRTFLARRLTRQAAE